MREKRKLSPKDKRELYDSVVPIAEEFRDRFLDKDKPIKDTFETLEQLGYFYVCFPAHDDLSGFHIKKGDFDCIFVNSAHSLGRQHFSAWHEVYHAYTKDYGGISLLGDIAYDEMEQKAEFFASCILMPEDLVRSYLRSNGLQNLKYISHVDLIRMQNYFRVSYKAMLVRLTKLFPSYKKDLSSRYALGLQGNEQKMEAKTAEAGESIELIKPTNDFSLSPRFYKMLHDNLQQDRISSERAASILELIESVQKKYEV
ncbi:ImmA/IrrE family metallo-endopeptidase [Rossellomorea aquimaris]|uniref:ImmA/IrrE family metallo-endopeptidase n=1 Tax=Rossellomorea TaxID=2837508 RepID=UPI0021CC9CDD|nr:ImmA/IrrE family metallo-endopeptidase [Rossellomorea aquimaris]